MLSRRLPSLLVLLLLAVGIAGCVNFGAPNDAVDAQVRAKENQAPPSPTELPPGLSNDLPATQPAPAH